MSDVVVEPDGGNWQRLAAAAQALIWELDRLKVDPNIKGVNLERVDLAVAALAEALS